MMIVVMMIVIRSDHDGHGDRGHNGRDHDRDLHDLQTRLSILSTLCQCMTELPLCLSSSHGVEMIVASAFFLHEVCVRILLLFICHHLCTAYYDC